jgi:2-iminobutanoate/2-iminopropanoate deaminase
MSIQHVTTTGAPAPAGAYSQSVVSHGLLFTAGQTPHDPQSGDLVGETIEEQTERALENIRAILAAYRVDFSHVVKATVHLHNAVRDFEGFNATYEKFMVAPYPVRTTVGSLLGGFLVEIDVIADLTGRRD